MYNFVILVEVVMTISVPNPVLGYLSEDESHHERENNELFNRRSTYVYDGQCPHLDGNHEFSQLIRYWSKMREKVMHGVSVTDPLQLASDISVNDIPYSMYSDISDVGPVRHSISTHLVRTILDYYSIRIVITEYIGDKPSDGGSTFYVTVIGSRTKVTCPTTDLFNGTYYICCEAMEDKVTLRVVHEHAHFSAYDTSNRYVYKELFSNTIQTPEPVPPLRRENVHICEHVNMGSSHGYWLQMYNQWAWSVDRCLHPIAIHPFVKQCFQERYHDSVWMMGGSHLANLYYYMMTYLHIEGSESLAPPHANITLQETMHYRYLPGGVTLKHALRAFAHEVENRNIRAPGLLILDMDVNNLIRYSADEYLLLIHKIASYVSHIVQSGIRVVWVDIAAVPSLNATREVDGKFKYVSNAVVNAVNFYAFETMTRVGAAYVQQWRFTNAWRDELICPGRTHTMCFNNVMYDEPYVTAAGHATAQSLINVACGQASSDTES